MLRRNEYFDAGKRGAHQLRSIPSIVLAKEIALAVLRRAAAVACLLATVAILAGGSSGRVVLPLWLDPMSLALPSNARALGSTEAAVRGVAAIMAKSFGLAVPDRVTVYVYAGRRAFERGLIQDARVSPVLAAKLSDFAIGVGARGQVLLNEDTRDRTERERLRLIAHELTHVSQIELAGGEGRGEQWLAEGMAEWVAFSTLERLGLDTLSRRRLAAASGVRNHATLLQGGLDLETRGTAPGFAVWHVREGSLPTYQLAFLIADHLIARQGLDRVKAYFASFARSSDRQGNFRRAFGESIADFEAGMLAHLNATSSLPP